MNFSGSEQLLSVGRGMLQREAISVYVLSSCELRLAALRALCTEGSGCYLVGTEKGVPENLELLRDRSPDVIVIDMDIFQGTAARSLEEIVDVLKQIAYVLILASYLDIASAYAAIAHGASGYLLTSTSSQHCVQAFQIVSCGGTWLEEDLRQAILHHVSDIPSREEKAELRLLSQREFQILQRIARGESHRTIAEDLYLSESSVRTYWHRVLTKLNAFSKVEAVTRAIKLGLLAAEPEPDEDLFSMISPRLRATLLARQQKVLPPAVSS